MVLYSGSKFVIRYKVYTEQHPRAGLNTQHVNYERNELVEIHNRQKSEMLIINKCTCKTILDQNDPFF